MIHAGICSNKELDQDYIDIQFLCAYYITFACLALNDECIFISMEMDGINSENVINRM